MTAETLERFNPVDVRRNSLRYLNLLRLVLAGLFLVAGAELNLGREVPRLFTLTAAAYLGLVLLLGFPDAQRRFGLERVANLQGLIDIIVMTLLMHASGGYGSGMPVLMMVMLAGHGLVLRERAIVIHAALATLLVLAENGWRWVSTERGGDFFQVGVACAGFFAIGLVSRLLARRALTNEALALHRGAELASQQAINERIIRELDDGVIVLDAQRAVRQANPRAVALLGVPLAARTRLVDADPALAAMLATPRDGDSFVQRVGRGGLRVRVRVIPIGDDDGGCILFLTDVEAIQRQIQQVKLAALGRLTASMAHEIRNPLSSVTQAGQLLLEERRGDMQLRLAQIISNNARRIERMVREVLSLGRRDSAMPEAVELAALVTRCINETCLNAPERACVVDQNIDPALRVFADAAHVQQIVANLLANASRHCSGKAGAVRVAAAVLDDNRVALSVADDGPGVPEGSRLRLFEPFYTTDANGTGLGLYIARELAEANGATLELVSSDEGACFVLTARSHV